MPVTTYLTRFFIMSPLHGIWDSLAGGLVFFLSGRRAVAARQRPMIGAYIAAYACAVVFHVAHNSLQIILGPAMQIVTVFTLLAPLYVTAKVARRRAAIEGRPMTDNLSAICTSSPSRWRRFFWRSAWGSPGHWESKAVAMRRCPPSHEHDATITRP